MAGQTEDKRASKHSHGSQGSQDQQTFFPLPKDVNVLANGVKCSNPGLWLDRYAEWQKKAGKLGESTNKRERVCESLSSNFPKQILDSIRKRQEKFLEGLQMQGYAVKSFSMTSASRVTVGLGAASVLETSIHLHRIYGFPVLPGSALKGLARSWGLFQIAEKLGVPVLSLEKCDEHKKRSERTPLEILELYLLSTEPKNKDTLLEQLRANQDTPQDALLKQLDMHQIDGLALNETVRVADWRAVFGSQGHQGKVIFFDAIPTGLANLLELDIMNPHYSPYYQDKGGKEPPADYHDPVPVFFLTIRPGSEFWFVVASKERRLALVAKQWLKEGLVHLGIGAKTVAGYGYWQENTQVTTSANPATPSQPPYSEKPPKRGDKVYAQVLDNSTKPIRVRLLVKGYEEVAVECAGVRNPSSCPPGTYVGVEITQMKGQQITQVSLKEIWKS